MSEITVMSIATKAITTGAMISAPVLIASLLIGLLISIFQAVTQIQEQTLTFVPKLIIVVVLIMFCGPWMMNKLALLTTELMGMIATITR